MGLNKWWSWCCDIAELMKMRDYVEVNIWFGMDVGRGGELGSFATINLSLLL